VRPVADLLVERQAVRPPRRICAAMAEVCGAAGCVMRNLRNVCWDDTSRSLPTIAERGVCAEPAGPPLQMIGLPPVTAIVAPER
jgi:hypothetical protein